MFSLTHLDLSRNQLTGSVPWAWADSSAGPLAASLQTLLLANNRLTGQLPNLLAMQALSCWSVANNPSVCGPVPPTAVCGAAGNTKLGAVAVCCDSARCCSALPLHTRGRVAWQQH
jgi:hypothetical protein